MTTQTAPWPTELEWLVKACKYREGWKFILKPDSDRGQNSNGTTLEIIIDCVDTYAPDEDIRIRHLFIVPAASYNMRSWRRWLFDRILDVEKHEAMEFFQIDGARPYAPNHGPGHDPYIIFEEGTTQEKRTSYLGEERSTDSPHTASPFDGFGPQIYPTVRASDFVDVKVGEMSSTPNPTSILIGHPESDDSLRKRLFVILTTGDLSMAQTATGRNLDMLANRHGIVRFGLNNDKDGDVPHA
jgi:hypothetical protein